MANNFEQLVLGKRVNFVFISLFFSNLQEEVAKVKNQTKTY
jgi:hypothetical protein